MSALFLTGAAVLADGAWRPGCCVKLRDGVIEAVLPEGEATGAPRVTLPPDSLLAPGLVDVQVNGGGGILFNDRPDAAAARAIAAAHRRLGTTAILPTLITDTPQAMRAALASLDAAGPADGVMGVHLEGPFLSPRRPGVHDARLIRRPDEADLILLEDAARGGKTVLLTLAPEEVDDAALRRLAGAGVLLSAGHSEASYERATAALGAGLRGFTHLFNAMPPAAARAPGLVTAALADPASWCGVIADGIHVHPAMLRALLAAKPPGRVMLVSDAMPPTGTDADGFVLQGRTILRRGGRLTTEDGTLAGADICALDAVRFTVRALGLTPARALAMATAAPADFLGLSGAIGRIAPGRRADLLLLTPGLDLLGTWCGGAWQGSPGVLGGAKAA